MFSVTISSRIGLSPLDSPRTDGQITYAAHAPVAHGMLRIDIEATDGIVTDATPVLGSMHRGAEKLFESRDYRQVLGLANRHEWLSAFSGEVGVAQLVEQALRMEVPQAAQHLRTLLLELNRVTSHLAFLAGFTWTNSDIADEFTARREKFVTHTQSYTGSRMHPMITRFGGLTHAPSIEWLRELATLASTYTVPNDARSDAETYSGWGSINRDGAIASALSGPVARASNYDIDLRMRPMGLSYALCNSFTSTSANTGDVVARLQVLMGEVEISCATIVELVELCIQTSGQDVNVLLPKVLRVPEGEYVHEIETPLGIASWFLVSRGDKMPYRLKLRPASLHTVLSLPIVLEGESIDRVPAIIASMPFVAGDVDR